MPSASRTRRRLTTARERLVDVVDTDVLVWEALKAPRAARAQLEVELVELRTTEDVERVTPPEHAAQAIPFVERGDQGFAAVADGRFAGWIWLSRASHRDRWSGLNVRLAADEGYAYALWIEPELRPKGVARVLMVAMLSAVHTDPALTRVYGWVDRQNRESQMLLRLLGFKNVQSVKRVMLLDRFGRALPRSDRPAEGPLSRHGRHRTAMAAEAPVNPLLLGDPL